MDHTVSSTGPQVTIGRTKESKHETVRDRDKLRASRDRRSASQHDRTAYQIEFGGKRERAMENTNRATETSDHTKWGSDREMFRSRDRSNRGSERSRPLARTMDVRDDKKGIARVERVEISGGAKVRHAKTISGTTRGSRDGSSRSSNWDKTSMDVNTRNRNTKTHTHQETRTTMTHTNNQYGLIGRMD